MSCPALVGPRICWRVGGTRDLPVEAVLPEGREHFELTSSSGWSRVEGIDAVGGSPYCDFANEGSGMISCYRPGWRVVTVPDAILDLLGEVVHTWHASLSATPAPPGSIPVDLRRVHHEVFPTSHGTLLTLDQELATVTDYPTSDTNPAAPRANATGSRR